MKWCDAINWSIQTDGRLWENQTVKDLGANGRTDMYIGETDCDRDEDCAGNLVCI